MNILASNYWTIWLLVLWVAPLLGFCIQMSVGPKLPREGDWVSIGAIGVSFVIALLLFGGMFSKEGGLHEPKTDSWVWIPAQIASDVPAEHGSDAHENQASGKVVEKARTEQPENSWNPSERHSLSSIQLGFHLDNLAIFILIVVTGVSLLVHIYSMGYMEGDPLYHRFFAFLNLFSFSMLGLVLVDNLIGLYIFWELVGLSSYLLIGFWFDNEDLGPAKASIKAFLTTRVGDIGMFIGILFIILHLGVLDYEGLFLAVEQGGATGGFSSHGLWTFTGVMLFMGAVGKSAQFPLHIWLPDAMEGPTPVSALIHAATMVAAGVYMVARLFPFFTTEALVVIAIVGGLTAIFAATMALVADDIKRVLAYSTISQLGYMVLALGVGAWFAGILHLYTHAFFKALLFLCSGSVIHAVHTNDMWKMGGLRKAMPWTFATMLIASLSISGVPLFSGFVSKDKILHETLLFGWENTGASTFGGTFGGVVDFLLPVFAFGAAVLTAFYMFRLIFLTFTGEPRDEEAYEHAHESPNSMVVPLVTLAILSTFLAVQFIPFTQSTHFDSYLEKPSRADAESPETKHALRSDGSDPSRRNVDHLQTDGGSEHMVRASGVGSLLAKAPEASENGNRSKVQEEAHSSGHGAHSKLSKEAHTWTLIGSFFILVIGIGSAGLMYWAPIKMIAPASVSGLFQPLYILFQRTYYFDELFYFGFVIPSIQISRFLAGRVDLQFIDALVDDTGHFTIGISRYSGWWDDEVVDRMVLSTAEGVGSSGSAVRSAQTGNIRTYLGFIGGGILVLAGIFIGFVEMGWGTPFQLLGNWFDRLIQSSSGGILAIVIGCLLLMVLGGFGSIFKDVLLRSVR